MEIRDALKEGKTCAFLALGASWGKLSVAVCVDQTIVPSGWVTQIGSEAGCMSETRDVVSLMAM